MRRDERRYLGSSNKGKEEGVEIGLDIKPLGRHKPPQGNEEFKEREPGKGQEMQKDLPGWDKGRRRNMLYVYVNTCR